MKRQSGFLFYIFSLIALYLTLRYGTKATMILNAWFNGGIKLARTLQGR